GLRDDRARLIDDEGKIAIAVREEFAGSGDAGRRHRRRHYLHTGQHPDQDGALQRSVVDGLDIELHCHTTIVLAPHRDPILFRQVSSGKADSREAIWIHQHRPTSRPRRYRRGQPLISSPQRGGDISENNELFGPLPRAKCPKADYPSTTPRMKGGPWAAR